jgi:hypothetical protein
MARWDSPQFRPTAAWAIGAIAFCAVARAGLAPTTRPATTLPAIATTEPVGIKKRSASPFPKKYDVLMTRSIFAHHQPGDKSAAEAAAMANAHKPGFVLRGVADQGGQRTALLEDAASGKTAQLHVGDETSGGRIVTITMDGLDRTVAGKVLHVGVGQPLDGGGAVANPNPPQTVAREDVTPVLPEPVTGTAIQAGAKILKMDQ